MRITTEIAENIKIYEDVLLQVVDFFINLGIYDDPVKIYETFRYLYINGYLSSRANFSDTFPEAYAKLELEGYLPMDVTGSMLLTGYGVCRHTSDFLSHIYYLLGYDASQLFTYHPQVGVHVHNHGSSFLTNFEAQKYIDEAMVDFDLFSKKEIHLVRSFGDLSIHIDYFPEPEDRPTLINHTMNIVLDKKGVAHIWDTRYHCSGESLGNDTIRLSHQGLTHLDFLQKDIGFHTYYGTNYFRGLGLLEHETNMPSDVIKSILYGESCKEYARSFEEFRVRNQESYGKAESNVHKLIRKLKN